MKRRPKARWHAGTTARLLENGEAFFPAVFEAIRHARREVLLETFIVFDDKVGQALHDELLQAARRGVQVHVLVDGFGSADLGPGYIQPLVDAGVCWRVFDPSWRLFGLRLNVLRRMHRKLVVVDGRRAFVGGINYSADHLADFGPEAKQDYAVELQGPVVDEIRRFALAAVESRRTVLPTPVWVNGSGSHSGGMAMFLQRDNREHRNDIERHYRAAIRSARRSVVIANAYFFPGFRLLHELRRAARRGVHVQLILQGKPDVPLARTAASLLYEHLLRDGVQIHEYCERPMHSKVAVVDDEWATVGSSNLDPLSLTLNLEANVVLRDRAFAATLRGRLDHLVQRACHPVTLAQVDHSRWWSPLSRWWSPLKAALLFHVLRHLGRWARWLPAHAPRLQVEGAPAVAEGHDAVRGPGATHVR